MIGGLEVSHENIWAVSFVIDTHLALQIQSWFMLGKKNEETW